MCAEREWTRKSGCPTHCFSIIIVFNPVLKQFLAVEETKRRGWWLPGGFVENGDDFKSTAVKETKEEAGIDVELKGILRIENSMGKLGARQRVIWFGIPKNLEQPLKSEPDEESMSAKWFTVQELEEMRSIPPPRGLRGSELLQWGKYLEQGGSVYPLSILSTEHTEVTVPTEKPFTLEEFVKEYNSKKQ